MLPEKLGLKLSPELWMKSHGVKSIQRELNPKYIQHLEFFTEISKKEG
jgi:hypothetical protein